MMDAMLECVKFDCIDENGVYIGNNQFISSNDMKLLKNILEEL
jgi:hypothetical protein